MNPKMTSDLKEFLSIPTAPFFEQQIASWVINRLEKKRVPFFFDSIGNLVIGSKNKKELQNKINKKSKQPLRIFIAHMDHPGFHGVKFLNSKVLEAEWHGGSPIQKLKGQKVWVCAADLTKYYAAKIESVEISSHRHGLKSLKLRFANTECFEKFKSKPTQLFGGFLFKQMAWQEKTRIYTKAADDLVGCFSIINTAIELWSKNKFKTERQSFVGVLTRAEEVGFVGAIKHFEEMKYQNKRRPMLAVSLEASRELPNAEVGKGPIVRLGDRNSVFDPNGLKILSELATKHLPKKHQKRIMDGGSCEATAALAFGIPAIGMSVPLGNYHNENFKTGGPGPEYVDTNDVEGMMDLCLKLMEKNLNWQTPWKILNEALKKRASSYKKYFL